MALEERLYNISYVAGADLSAKQYHLVKPDTTAGQVIVATEGSRPLGVLQNAPAASGRAATVAVGGITKIMCGGNVSVGDRLSADSLGRAVAVGSSDDNSMGIANTAGTSGNLAEMLIQPTGLS